MLYSAENVRANIRNRQGKRVFYLHSGDSLTPSARDWLRQERIEILPAQAARPEVYRLENGSCFSEKPEHFTHLRGDILVPKTHPVIAFRGAVDTLQAALLLAQQAVPSLQAELGEILVVARKLLRWEVMEEPAEVDKLCGLTLQQQRAHSHDPRQYYGIAHFMPEASDSPALLQLNQLRCTARAAELAAAQAFILPDGTCSREDLLQVLNRMSSMLYILMIQLKSGKKDPASGSNH